MCPAALGRLAAALLALHGSLAGAGASGDFDRDGLEDIAVWATMGDGPTQDHGTRLFILTRRGRGRLLEVLAER